MGKFYSSRLCTIYGVSRTKFDILIILKVFLKFSCRNKANHCLFVHLFYLYEWMQVIYFIWIQMSQVTPFSAFLLQIHLVSNSEYCVLRHSAKPLVSICFGQTTSTSFSTNNILNLLCYWQYLFFTIDVQVTFASSFFWIRSD